MCEGSSIDLAICPDQEAVCQGRQRLGHHTALLAERFVAGQEVTVGVVSDVAGDRALPPIWIVPQVSFYDYQAKYVRDDTRYVLDAEQVGVSAAVSQQLCRLAVDVHRVLGCRHMSRVDFIVDKQERPWILEVNTVPGFTAHSLLPKAASAAGWPLHRLVDHLVRIAGSRSSPPGAGARGSVCCDD